jgi:hypothetical protein
VDGQLILERNNPQETAFKLFDRSPEAIAVVFLPFNSYRMFHDPDTPLFFDIGPFAQHLIFKIAGELVAHHWLPE